MKKCKITIIGPTFSGNKGSATMLTSGIDRLEKTLSVKSFALFSYYPKEDKKVNPYRNVKIYSLSPKNLVIKLFPLALIYKLTLILRLPVSYLEKFPEIKALKDSDMVIDMAGVSFIDGREKFLPFNILTILLAMLMGKPIIKFSQSLGPFNKLLNRWAAKIFLPKIQVIFARGVDTAKYLQGIGLKNTIQLADGGFCLEIREKDTKYAQKLKFSHRTFFQKPVVGIAPSSVVSSASHKQNINYESIFAQFIDSLISKKYSIILFPYSLRKQTTSSFNNDLPVCREIFNLIKDKSSCLIVEDDLPPKELNATISLCQLFVACRFHAVVASLSSNIPTLVCGWSHKYREVLKSFGLDGYAFSYKTLSHSILENKFQKLNKNQAKIRQQIKENLPMVKKSSQKQALVVKNLLEVSIKPGTETKSAGG